MGDNELMTAEWLQPMVDHPAVADVAGRLTPRAPIAVSGLWGSSGHLFAGALSKQRGGSVLLVLAHLDDADEAAEDLALLDGIDPAVFPALEVLPGETHASLELLAERLAIARRLNAGDVPDVLIAPVQALMQGVPSPEAMGRVLREIAVGEEHPVEDLIDWLAAAGYERLEAIESPGQFAVRGGIVDIFPPDQSPPIRLDFFGDEVETIAEIDLETMASNAKRQRIRLIGAGLEQVREIEDTVALWSMLTEDVAVVVQEPMEVAEQARGYFERITDARGIYPPKSVFAALHERPTAEVSQFTQRTGKRGGSTDAKTKPEAAEVALPVEALPDFDEDVPKAITELADLALGRSGERAHQAVVVCPKPAERERLEQLLQEHAPEAVGTVSIADGYLHRGFIWASGDKPLLLVPHHELFHRYTVRRRVRRISSGAGQSTEAFFDLEVGDYVVHQEHGIAIFRGLRTMRREGQSAEYLTLEFADKALLHVPAARIELVQKYIGGFAGRPPLSKLGGSRWQKQKEQVAEAVRDLARELLQVQAARASLPGHRYPEDTAWMSQFEDEFPYEETDDQLAAIAEVKRDMMSDRPMDRLICGDVGFGKTEVAMRGAFKAVEAGKQVAVLCPTTVLCEQHERSFHERMADYPVRIASVSRFKSAGEVKKILQETRDGKVDILIGTHRLLSKDVVFHDLGLVVVDEEQRFGVEHKNKLMQMRVTVDVLTLSATPIPRTLHMAMVGLRDIASLSVAPADRRAIVTEVVPHDNKRIRRGILREINREGQVYFVHNRVQNIHEVANEVRALVPEARVIVGHGQMQGHELEEVMLKFIRREADVLVCTTIIESGIDIPTANTMFVSDADRFGLAELHQLRGRVGRYKHRAYCYLLLPRTRALTNVASRRLRAIEEFSMLGAGFKIAMRDMEIRGVGNILGPQQSGHIATVGYQMYCQLLEEATAELKREPIRTTLTTHLELGFNGALPKSYIPSDKHRMEAYRRINRAGSLADLHQVESDLVDAYGALPEMADRLIQMAEVRIGLMRLEVTSLRRDDRDLIFLTEQVQPLYEQLADAPGSVRLVDPPGEDKPGSVYFRPPANYLENPKTLLAVLRKLLRPEPQPAGAGADGVA